ncbi:hypothetical protein [Ensifer sesbaniae]|uniref:hypothetical protein n=1 Tax=Ensifer sesbaniae TaxID=1214071 RepID=UPI00156861B2|nr:hypothetical protein [Ensifer sesbaniae]NRQ15052.1 hypothetical protein [Ensifer sesbaniae]
MRRHLRLLAVVLPLVVLTRYMLFDDAAEFQRFYAALRIYVAPVIIVSAAVLAVIMVATATKKVYLGPPERVIKACLWGSSAVLAAALAYAFAVAKLAGAP